MSQNQEKLYIDVDEEITTVVDRLRHSPAQNVAVVVPQRAVLLQSIVNLRLLKREAKKLGKSLILMTKDEEGIVFASRAGIEVQPFVGSEESMLQQDLQSQNYFSAAPYQDVQQNADNFFQAEDVDIKNLKNFENQEIHQEIHREERPSMDVKIKRKKRVVSDSLRAPQYENEYEQQQIIKEQRFQDLSSFDEDYLPKQQGKQELYQNDYQDSHQSFNDSDSKFFDKQQENYEYKEDDSYYSLKQDYSQDLHQEHSSFYDEPNRSYKPKYNKNDQSLVQPETSKSSFSYKPKNSKNKEKTPLSSKKQKKEYEGSGFGSLSKWIFGGGFLIVILIGVFIVLPKTTLTIKIKEIDIEESVSLTAKTDQDKIDKERMIIPARQIEKQVVYTKSFDSTGKADVNAQKAQGMVTLYNEYSENDEKLVKTTRFLSEDGVLFRLAENVTIPGMKEVDGKKEPGKVKVLLVADKSGESGNIDATTFRIAAYKEKNDTKKYEGLYAKSDSKMQGGGAGGKNMSVVTEEDINKAKEVMEKNLPTFIESEISDLVRDEEVLTKDAIDYKIVSLGSKVTKDTAVNSFEYEVTAEVSALVFSQEDVDKLVYEEISEKNKDIKLTNDDIDIKYNSFESQFDAGNLKMLAKATAKFKPEFDVEKFKEDIVGKNYEEIGNLIRNNYTQIESDINSNVFPPISLMGDKISQVKQMTEIIIE